MAKSRAFSPVAAGKAGRVTGHSAIAAAVVVALGIGGCAGAPHGPMLLGGGDSGGAACLPTSLGMGEGYFFGEWVGNDGRGTIEIVSVRLREPENVELASASVMPTDRAIGAVTDPIAASGLDWLGRVDAATATIPHGEHVNLVGQLRLIDPRADGSAAGLDVRYTVDGMPHRASSTTVYLIAPDCTAAIDAWTEQG